MRRRGRSTSPGAACSPPASCLTMSGWYRRRPAIHNDTKTLRLRLVALQVLLDLPLLPVVPEDREGPVDLEGVGHEPDAPPEQHPVEPEAVGIGEEVEHQQEEVDD